MKVNHEMSGSTLKNGAKVLLAKEIEEGNIVLARHPEKNEYITWYMNSNGDTFMGHYFGNFELAYEDFFVRN